MTSGWSAFTAQYRAMAWNNYLYETKSVTVTENSGSYTGDSSWLQEQWSVTKVTRIIAPIWKIVMNTSMLGKGVMVTLTSSMLIVQNSGNNYM